MIKLEQKDYFDDRVEMHYALFESAANISKTLHTHDFFEVFFVLAGRIEHVVNAARHTLRSGSLTFIRPSDAHAYRAVRGSPCRVINLAVSQEAIRDLFTYLGAGFAAERVVAPSLPPTVQLTSAAKEHIRLKLEHLNNVRADSEEGAARKRTALRMLLFELLTQYFSYGPQLDLSGQATAQPKWLEGVCAEMQKPENLVRGVPRMLELSGVSAEHLARTVRKHLAQTPTAYVNDLRLTYAGNLLSHADRPILDVAADVGFESLSYFYTLFKKRYGHTPKQFRRLRQLPHVPSKHAEPESNSYSN